MQAQVDQTTRECHICGAPYEPVKPWQKCCSSKCNSVASNTRRRRDPSQKQCRSCRELLPAASFEPLHRNCRACEELRAAGQKRCTKCREVKAFDDFYRRPNRTDGYGSQCRRCRSGYSRRRNAAPEKKRIDRDRKLRLKYGISVEDTEEMFRRQEGRCAICCLEKGLDQLHVDHNHTTGAVRSLLCMHCNALLGYAKENAATLRASILYLERHSNDQNLGP